MAKGKRITCKLTGTIGEPVEAHIIPRSLLQLDGKPGKMIFFGEKHYREQRAPIGVYDQTILTHEGESHFSNCDDYAAKFFLNRGNYNEGKNALIRMHEGTPILAEIEESKQNDLKFFCMAVLWRASVSSRPFFKEVDLGNKHEARLKELILAKSVGEQDEYGVVLMRHIDTPECGLPINAPNRDRQDKVLLYRFNLPQFSFVIKADMRPMPSDLRQFQVGASDKLRMILLDPFKSSEQYRLLRKHHA